MAPPSEPEDGAYGQAFAQRLGSLEGRIAQACRRSGRDRAEVRLVAVSKGQPLERLVAARRAGVQIFGENRVQEAEDKIARFPPPAGASGAGPAWHLIGPLQSNKTKRAVELFESVHSMDRLKIARRLESEAQQQDKVLQVFLQVNVGEEDSKHGFTPETVPRAAAELAELAHLRLVGLMAIPPQEDDPEDARRWFRDLARLRDQLSEPGPWGESLWHGGPGLLSMGMSGDFEVAIEEGATHVRVGTALFGPRSGP